MEWCSENGDNCISLRNIWKSEWTELGSELNVGDKNKGEEKSHS